MFNVYLCLLIFEDIREHTRNKMSLLSTTQAHRERLQRQTQADWVNREYIELITGSIKRIADFLNSFDMSCRSRLSVLNEKLTYLGNLDT